MWSIFPIGKSSAIYLMFWYFICTGEIQLYLRSLPPQFSYNYSKMTLCRLLKCSDFNYLKWSIYGQHFFGKKKKKKRRTKGAQRFWARVEWCYCIMRYDLLFILVLKKKVSEMEGVSIFRFILFVKGTQIDLQALFYDPRYVLGDWGSLSAKSNVNIIIDHKSHNQNCNGST